LYTGAGTPPPNFVVKCKCGWTFCFHCKERSHLPATCEQNRIWKDKLAAEGGQATWLFKNTKGCPSCKVPIEKNEGCLHMTCKCGHEFCWMVCFYFFYFFLFLFLFFLLSSNSSG
jgi:ariadne-1